ncbi:hypothetical protein EC973_002672 [Apophysomyces ossiformis]|uniref:HTH APSES-type domain-containing protein n=1 Tax=Apophysomyces ossiformis TaxID=679940 RepID=A0A8H7EMR5_9FUNG|nr:hypothetical protein EC973_002672 [Apophysomyces ossiformis]
MSPKLQASERNESTSAARVSQQQQKPGLPVPIHPDDAKDKVFTAILKALLKMGNKPSSPKELANVIIKYKYATLGGATPFATVSSRISQHFKRAAEHNPPRAPLLAKHVDQHHSRKINYSLATERVSPEVSSAPERDTHKPSSTSPSASISNAQAQTTTQNFDDIMSDTSTLSSEEEDEEQIFGVRHPKPTPSATRRKKRYRAPPTDTKGPEGESEDEYHHVAKRLRHQPAPSLPLSPVTATSSSSASSSSLSPPSATSGEQRDLSSFVPPVSPPILTAASEEESEAEYSDYYEEMLKGDENMIDVEVNHQRPSIARRPSIQPLQTDKPEQQPGTSAPVMPPVPPNGNQSLDQEIWTPYTFEQNDLDSMFLSDGSTTHHIPFNIAAPESISVSELDTYFNNGNSNSSSGSSARTSRKSFSSNNAGSKDPSLLQKVLLANAAKGTETIDTASLKTSPEDKEDFKPNFPRRKSWPSEQSSAISLDTDRQITQLLLPLPNEDKIPPFPPDLEKTSDPIKSEPPDNKRPSENTSEENSLTETELNERKYFSGGHSFTIAKKTFGNIQCYELFSPHDIPDTRVLRFIKSIDGASEHVALRTRHADSKDRRNSQYFYLTEGYVNATQLRKAARPVLGKGSFDAAAEITGRRVAVSITKGPLECRGTWVPLSRARELVEEFEIESSPGLCKLLSDDPLTEDSKQLDLDTGTTRTQEPTKPTENNPTKSYESSEQVQAVANTDVFVNFEDDEKKLDAKPVTNIVTNIDSLVTPVLTMNSALLTTRPVPEPVSNVSSSAADLLKSMNIQNLDLSALHQITSSTPTLAHLSPTFDLAKSLAAYLQSAAKPNSAPVPSSWPSSLAADLKSALSRFPLLDALLRKDISVPTSAPSAPSSSPTNPPAASPFQSDQSRQPLMIHTTVATDPLMYISVLDNVAVCVAVLPKTEDSAERKIMRRLDSGFINGTALLTAGGIETERERSMILSFEMERVRMANKSSALCGTWIPLRRAQELAVTCSIQHRLGPFLSNNIEEYFPKPLPIEVTSARKPRDTRITALVLEALRNSCDNTRLMSSSSPSLPTNAAAAQLHQLLLTNPHKALKIGDDRLKAPLLGYFDDSNDTISRRRRAVVGSPVVVSPKPTAKKEQWPTGKIEDSQDNTNGNESAEDTDSDTEVEEVRRQVKKMRDAAIDAMENASSAELEEMLSRAKQPLVQQARKPEYLNAQPIRKQRQRRVTEEEAQYRNGRRRPNGGKWSGGKIAPSMIRKSATWNGAMSTPRINLVIPTKKKTKKVKNAEEANRVVEHKPSATTTPINNKSLPTVQEDDEDEEIDIGGSDRDDDLR